MSMLTRFQKLNFGNSAQKLRTSRYQSPQSPPDLTLSPNPAPCNPPVTAATALMRLDSIIPSTYTPPNIRYNLSNPRDALIDQTLS